MNHPTDRAEELYSLAQEAAACGDIRQSIIFLRKALDLAPLRRDFKQALAELLALESDSDTAPAHAHERQTSEVKFASRTAAAPSYTSVSRHAAAQSMHGAQSAMSRHGSHPTASSPTIAAASRQSNFSAPSQHPSHAHMHSTIRTEGNLSLAVSEEMPEESWHESNEWETQSDATLQSALESADEPDEEIQPRPKRARRRRSAKAEPSAMASFDFEEVIATVAARTFTFLGDLRRSTVAYVVAYLFVTLFTAGACLTCYHKFGIPKQSSPVAAAQTASVQTPATPVVALAERPTSIPSAAVPTDGEIFEKASALAAEKKHQAALELLRPRLTASQPTALTQQMRKLAADLHERLGTQDIMNQRFESAVNNCRAALDLSGNQPQQKLQLANAVFYASSASANKTAAKADLQEAIRLGNEVLEVQPSNPLAHQALAQAYQALGRKADAKKAWQKVVQHSAKNPKTQAYASEQLKELSKGS